jgi:hypothetical protein
MAKKNEAANCLNMYTANIFLSVKMHYNYVHFKHKNAPFLSSRVKVQMNSF